MVRTLFSLFELLLTLLSSYLLSPQTSVMGGLGGPGTRLVLLGSQSPHINPIFFRDPDPIIFTEIAEFALSLKAPTKGQEPFHGFTHLQAYKFIRAAYLADIGHIQSATRYTPELLLHKNILLIILNKVLRGNYCSHGSTVPILHSCAGGGTAATRRSSNRFTSYRQIYIVDRRESEQTFVGQYW